MNNDRVILEAAINGATPKARNAHVPCQLSLRRVRTTVCSPTGPAGTSG